MPEASPTIAVLAGALELEIRFSAVESGIEITEMITYQDHLSGITEESLQGFFVGWPAPPQPDAHLKILRGSHHVWLALDEGQVVGFINAISDGVLSAFIPLLEVLPPYQGQGIGRELVRRMAESLNHLYNIDLLCDPELQDFYQKAGFVPMTAMAKRNYRAQSGKVQA